MTDLTLYNGSNNGTKLDEFDFQMALAPGMSESTTLAQIAKALAYWQNVSATQPDSELKVLADGYAIPWLTALQGRFSNPPANSLRLVYPV